MRKKIYLLTLLQILLVVFCTRAQLKKYSLNECIKLALENNGGLKTAELNIEHERQNRKNATEIPKTNLIYTQGQFNSIYRYDENITVSQTIPFPTVFTSRLKLAKAQEVGSRYSYEATRAELIYQLKSCYYTIAYLKQEQKLMMRGDSIYQDFLSHVKQKFGEKKATLLEVTTAETEALEIHNYLLLSDEEIRNVYQELYTLMNNRGGFEIENIDIRYIESAATTDTSVRLMHPLLKHYEQVVEINNRSIALEKAKIFPDITLSYFNQTIYGPANIFGDDYFLTKQNRLQGVVVGVALPLWFFPSKSRVEAARIFVKQAQSDYDYHNTLMHGQYVQAVNQYLKYKKSVAFYKNSSLVNSNSIILEANTSYQNGEINYVDYIQIISHALNIENKYLRALHESNLAALKLEYLTAK